MSHGLVAMKEDLVRERDSICIHARGERTQDGKYRCAGCGAVSETPFNADNYIRRKMLDRRIKDINILLLEPIL